jgi:hypothetical protein
MTLNASGPISLNGTTAGESIAVELGLSGSTALSLDDASVRDLSGIASGQIIMPTDFYGKTYAPAATITNVANATSGSNLSSYTFTVNFGATGSNRHIVVGVYQSGSAGTTRTISSMTIGGIGATLITRSAVNNGAASISGSCALFYASVPTGTSGNVVVTLNAAASNAAISVFAAYNLNTGVTFSNSVVNSNTVGAGSATAKGVGVGFSVAWQGSPTFSWTGLTAIWNSGAIENAVAVGSAAAAFSTSSSLTTTGTKSAGTSQCLSVAYLR